MNCWRLLTRWKEVCEMSDKKACRMDWQKEYLKILERLEYPTTIRQRPPLPDADSEAYKLYSRLWRELNSEGLIQCDKHPVKGNVCDENLTYKGRLELDRLRGWRVKQKFETCVKVSAIWVAIATVVSAACAIVSCCQNSCPGNKESSPEIPIIDTTTTNSISQASEPANTSPSCNANTNAISPTASFENQVPSNLNSTATNGN